MANDNEIPEWFLLDLPPINLYTANLLMPYYNGVEECRMNGITQPSEIKSTTQIHGKVVEILNNITGEMKKCQAKCKLDKSTLTCTGCGRTIEEIRQAGLAAKAANNRGEINETIHH